jgi:hypothetical protein
MQKIKTISSCWLFEMAIKIKSLLIRRKETGKQFEFVVS